MNDAGLVPNLEVCADREELAETAADALAERLRARLGEAPRASLAVCGGTTPGPAFDRLGGRDLGWDRIDVTLTDERFVAPSSPDSNERLVRRRLLKGPAAAARFTPLWAEAPTPEAAAVEAEAQLAPLLPFDCILLGMGEDGHVASLFPGSPALAEGLDPESARLCVGVPSGVPAPPQPRISLTLRALLDAGLILILITGEAKRRTLEAVAAGADLPVAAVLGQTRTPVRVLWSP